MKVSNTYKYLGLLLSIKQISGLLQNTYLNIGYVFILIGLFTIIIQSDNKLRKPLTVYLNRGSNVGFFYILYLLIIILSAFYTFDGNIARWFYGIVPFLFAILIFIQYPFSKTTLVQSSKSFWHGFAIGSVIVITIVILFGGVTSRGRIGFSVLSYSVVGLNAFIVLAYYLASFIEGTMRFKISSILFVLISIIGLVITTSKSTILSVLIIFPLLLVLTGKFKIKYLFGFAFFLAIGIIPFLGQFANQISIYKDEGSIMTLTGRVGIWAGILELIKERPLLGYGYNAPSTLLTAEYFDIWNNGRDIVQAHNFILHSILNVGIIGTVVLIIAFFAALIKLTKQFKNEDLFIYSFFTSIFVFFFLRGITEASIANGASMDVFMFAVLMQQLIMYSSYIQPVKKINASL